MNQKNVLMIFKGSEGTTYINDMLSNAPNIFVPGYEILDLAHVKPEEEEEFKENLLELAKFIFNPEEASISDEKIKTFFPKLETKQSIIEIKKSNITFLKWRVPNEMYQYLNNDLAINTILLPIRYSFSRIYNSYFKRSGISIFRKFKDDRNIAMEENIGKLVIDKDLLEQKIEQQKRYLDDFKIKYNELKKTNIPIIILDYYYINDNEYLNKKIGKLFDIDFNSKVLRRNKNMKQVKKTTNWFDLFDENSKEIILKEKEKYENNAKKEIITFLEKECGNDY